ncbi:hypothetical protein O6H91_14G056300 [Diphasiastrum complanatum]|uniref:Uncharacterized protein n=1 Tax=Diphasiastrum complanatum TaxID=34168 RepID=A0ACC2BPQ4_DIPCM|nr:hypothetical protein O6H91_14G056300 [Diphasiastrum complanatum]
MMMQSDEDAVVRANEIGSRSQFVTHTADAAYLQLTNAESLEVEGPLALRPSSSPSPTNRLWRWTKIGLLVLLLLAAGGALAVWGLPLILDKVVIPMLVWEASSFSKPVLALVLILSLAVFPVILIPSGPSMWVAGMIFGYLIGFIIIFMGTTVGQSLAYLVGHWLFHDRIQKWLQRWPKRAALLRVAEQGGWLHQFRTIVLLRFSPIPYTIFNYLVCATNIRYSPYILGSLIGMIPEAFITIYSGRLLRTLAEMKHSKMRLTPVQIIYNIVGFSLAIVVLITGTIYARRALRDLEQKGAAEEYEATNSGWQEDLRSNSSIQLIPSKLSEPQNLFAVNGTQHQTLTSGEVIHIIE